ncbi:MAG: septum site-determining protein MinC [Defluviitaleaceae bacterium]|nr:septum site-determining protein MinC [Defluviitaleaceae bacterium]
MDKANKVYFKATKDNIIVMLDDEMKFDELKASLILKAKDARKFFGDLSASVVFRGRDLTSREEAVLVDIIESETNLKVYVTEEDEEDNKAQAKEDDAGDISKFIKDQRMEGAVFHNGSLRSGMKIETQGSVVIIGDVNPGGEITAGGNIVVLGALKGLAHAGAYGNSKAFVAALALLPVQIRIADMITIVADEVEKQKKEGNVVPSYAYIRKEKICIEPLL